MPDGEQGNKEGTRRAVWSTGLMEAPLLYACDTTPLAVYDLGRLSAAEEAAALSEEYFDMPKETCSMVSALLGEWYLRRDNTVKKVVALSTVCEPLNMAYEMIKEFGFDIHRVEQVIRPVHGGEERFDQMVKFLASELEDVAHFLTGKPVDEIVNLSAQYDLIVMPTHGRVGINHFLMGSVAERVVKGAQCSVLVVKPQAQA